MAYHFMARASGATARSVQQALARLTLIEWFSIEASEDAATFGISVPFSSLELPGLEAELVSLMTGLVVDHECEVADLYSGTILRADEVAGLLERVSR
jgi:hypothetical protein